ncbi:uncharacterized protein MELLADRAFT_58201 [Melampsora larici-populina 98AG31]|uniref:Uncharacterized protein n=1 Tax=Melampsora larici-populina (strain 98AG31 / pathotype 3-4-7) TaxID=747676 RepID=F4SC63_MELLP|nr:uncharacterized protein MELLADRAFT_58201 [Melampsora larici-populina 98AG31]EGF97763.1 hypothetical protein MELLADRAFT_58201 [Melampsora larici-populina 98AG31]
MPVKKSSKPCQVQPGQVMEGVAAVHDALNRLKNDSVSCTKEFWLSMPTMGYAISSAFERPVISLANQPWMCHSFLPYRIEINRKDPIVLSFVDSFHFVVYSVKPGVFPFPPLFRQGWANHDNLCVSRWKEATSSSWALWQELYPPTNKAQVTLEVW